MGQADADRASLPSQRAVNQQTAERYGLTIVRTFEMAGVSGAQVLFAPEMQQMIRIMQDSEIHGVITREFSRLMRPENFADYALLQSFVDTNTVLYLPEGPIDFSSDSGMILGTVHATLGGIERKQMKRKIWNAKEIKRREGKLAQSRIVLPYGVEYPWAWTPDAEKVREVYRLFLSGLTSYAQLSKILGVTPVGARVIMRNPIYTGWRVIDEKRNMTLAGLYPTKDGRQGDRRRVKRSPDEIIRVRIPELEPLISESEWNHVQRLMDHKHENSTRVRCDKSPRFVYNGYMRCTCGSLIYAKRHHHNDYYLCKERCGTKYMEKGRLERALNRLFTEQVTRPSFVQKHLAEPLQTQRAGADPRTAQANITKLEAKRTRILDAYFEGVIDGTERTRRLEGIERDIAAARALASAGSAGPSLTLDDLRRAFAPFRNYDLLSRDDKRRLLGAMAATIVAADYRIERFVFSLDGGDKLSHTAAGKVITPRFCLKLGIAA